ncbi:UbiA family prenyltransferase [Streptomyces sp. B-S-A8]|uniref:UbiA family prenyltransferase n=1 Tax=Streptomyces solicavernae TaxID=3043614 RepID=A0ABT6S1X4_9ACTN|nr:UbiA family prenyltransferase [Streptomyces sp. B-S-A8]MDI3389891.1 UbiA family prenyltransferase [Streptomyces sp. B-S-A8]
MTTRAEAPPSAPRELVESKLRSYARLGKLDVYDYYPSIAVALSAALAQEGRAVSAALPAAALFLLGSVFVIMSGTAFDDLTGYRDGSDTTNYGPDDPLRDKRRKPLVAGALTEREALGFAWLTAAAGAALWTAAVASAPHRSVWAVLVTVLLFAASVQYSYGLKISYHGFQEAFLCGLGVGLVLAPYGLATGSFSGFVLVQAVLFGFGPLMCGVCSNTNDIPGDRSVRRPTAACLLSPRGNAVFVGALAAAEFLLVAGASATGIAPWWFVLLMLPVTALRVRQYVIGFRGGDILRARRLGFRAHRVCFALLIAANLILAVEVAG